MKQRSIKIIIVLLVTIFLLANFSFGSQENCAQGCPECQKIVTDSCCQNSMTASNPSHSSTSQSSKKSCNQDQFCAVIKEHTNLFLSSSSQSPTPPPLAFAFSTSEQSIDTSKLTPGTPSTNHIYTDVHLHILHCSFII